jgi:cytochrome P450
MLINPDFLRDPYPAYAALREQGPLHWSEEFFGGAWLLTRYEDVAWALKAPELSAQRTGGWVNRTAQEAGRQLAPFQRLFARALLFLDAPGHTALRQALMPAFRPAGLALLRSKIQAQIDALLQTIEAQAHSLYGLQPVDLVAKLAGPLPARVMTDWLGLQHVDLHKVRAWSDAIAAFLGHPEPSLALGQGAQEAALGIADAFMPVLQARRAQAKPEVPADLLDVLLQAPTLTSTEALLAQCVMFLFAGFETTRHLLSNGLHALLSQPGAWQQLQQNPDGLPLAVRELLRFDSPVQYTGRRVAQPLTRHGRLFKRGDLLIALIGAAHRDPSVYSAPDALQLQRRQAPHLAFGQGPHVCIGAALTHLEVELTLGTLLQRWPDLQLAQNAPEYLHNPLYRGLKTLPVWPRSGPFMQGLERPQ